MKRFLPQILAAVLGLTAAQAAEPESAALSAGELASRLAARQQDGNSYIRLKMETAGAAKTTLQVQIKSRASKSGADLVYQVLWPKERKGEAVLLRRSSGRAASGALFTPPDTTRPLTAAQMDDPLLGSALSYEDVIENFFAWEKQSLGGTETLNKVNCQILESKPGKGDSTIYTSVRSWIDPRRLVPMRVEKYTGAGKLARRIDTTRVANDDQEHPVPAYLSVRDSAGTVTEIDGSKIKHGVSYTAAEFTPEGMKQITVPRGEGE